MAEPGTSKKTSGVPGVYPGARDGALFRAASQ